VQFWPPPPPPLEEIQDAAIPCSFVLGSKLSNWLSLSVAVLSRKSLFLAACHWINCMIHPFVPFYAHASAVSESNDDKFPRIPNLCHLMHSIMSDPMLHYCFPNHCSSVFYNECIKFLLIVFCGSGGDSLSTAARQVSNVPIATREVFYQTFTWLTPMQESPLTWRSQSEMFAADLFSFTRNAVTACFWNVTILPQWIMDKHWCACSGPVCQIAEDRYSYQLYKYNHSLVMLIMHKLMLLITFGMAPISLNCNIFYLPVKLENLCVLSAVHCCLTMKLII
jgi:hypothetical protein